MTIQKIISGGQTGIDRAALDVAMAFAIDCGGWCPAGRRSESGPVPDFYPLQETAEASYQIRTERNVQDSDGTLIVSFKPLYQGTALTEFFTRKQNKPCLIIPPRGLFVVELIEEWIKQHKITVLNIAGPRESSQPGIYEQAKTLLTDWLKAHLSPK